MQLISSNFGITIFKYSGLRLPDANCNCSTHVEFVFWNQIWICPFYLKATSSFFNASVIWSALKPSLYNLAMDGYQRISIDWIRDVGVNKNYSTFINALYLFDCSSNGTGLQTKNNKPHSSGVDPYKNEYPRYEKWHISMLCGWYKVNCIERWENWFIFI